MAMILAVDDELPILELIRNGLQRTGTWLQDMLLRSKYH